MIKVWFGKIWDGKDVFILGVWKKLVVKMVEMYA